MKTLYRIKNFRSIENAEVELKPLTFLFGPNGSGKSSFIKSLLFFRRQFELEYGGSRYKISKNVNLLNYEQTVFRNDITKDISLEIEVKLSPSDFMHEDIPQDILDLICSSKEKSTYHIILNFSKKVSDSGLSPLRIEDRKNNIVTNGFCSHNIDCEPDFSFARKGEEEDWADLFEDCTYFGKNISIDEDYELEKVVDDGLIELNRKLWNLYIEDNHKIGEPRSKFSINYEELKELINDIDDDILDKSELCYVTLYRLAIFMSSILPKVVDSYFQYPLQHVLGVRGKPKQVYLMLPYNEENDVYFTDYIQGLINLYSGSETTEYSHFDRIFRETNNLLYVLGFDFTLNFKLNGVAGEFVLENSNGTKTALIEASSGVLQIIPILFSLSHTLVKESLLSSPYGLTRRKFSRPNDMYSYAYRANLLIEQPELHLHPKLQMKLAELFANNINQYRNIIIETHSEHMIRKIQVMIAKGELSGDKVGVYYFDNINGATKVKEMKMDKRGLFLEDWPDGFFDDSTNLTLELYDALRMKNRGN